ncbi:rlpA-like lipoprotein [Candidatus Photodesmus katoptron]|uniref:Endolytic peptidoglycan transglycosylase RlpA n=1 Tax=Candidatus Photodesmus katoptron Akat1 TaxID=1236703 RepID=S3EGU1_9GAMM|nr:septal ring lytic transglycosylase RlpA family protein [Candidatus Photodesmus katoptron]EPE37378.1 rare lipoprotein A [Candidatus Photodesmus katoptron Akat1]KEY90785.1 rlpA-like lipoprotein [Candidatus Photodesmus katoptron]
MKQKYFFLLITIIEILLLSGCLHSRSRYSIDNDLAPKKPISLHHIEDVVPRYELYSIAGNKNYTLNGNSYLIIKNTKDFSERGIASWYGEKFHGHLTANGEVYDMYSMSAAHKTLPIPSYVKVINLDNGKSTIVRINDRGPFLKNRIIDLSYASASKLDMIKSGVANVVIEAITIDAPPKDMQQKTKCSYVIQLAASQDKQYLKNLSEKLKNRLLIDNFITHNKRTFRFFLGPFNNYILTQKTLEQVKVLGYHSAFIKKYNC